MTTIKLIVGLANPGSEYAQTRHNAGEWLINSLAAKYGQSLKNEPKFFGYTSKITIAGHDIRLLVPTTFMNLSGKSVQAIANFYNIKPDEILVAHDELDINPGIAKLKFGGSHGGHNGLKDIANKLGNNLNFYRLRIGIGHPGDKSKVVGYVLNKPSKPEQELIDQAVDESVYGIEKMLSHGIEAAMNHLHAFKAK